jgi:hypothetical protein
MRTAFSIGAEHGLDLSRSIMFSLKETIGFASVRQRYESRGGTSGRSNDTSQLTAVNAQSSICAHDGRVVRVCAYFNG